MTRLRKRNSPSRSRYLAANWWRHECAEHAFELRRKGWRLPSSRIETSAMYCMAVMDHFVSKFKNAGATHDLLEAVFSECVSRRELPTVKKFSSAATHRDLDDCRYVMRLVEIAAYRIGVYEDSLLGLLDTIGRMFHYANEWGRSTYECLDHPHRIVSKSGEAIIVPLSDFLHDGTVCITDEGEIWRYGINSLFYPVHLGDKIQSSYEFWRGRSRDGDIKSMHDDSAWWEFKNKHTGGPL